MVNKPSFILNLLSKLIKPAKKAGSYHLQKASNQGKIKEAKNYKFNPFHFVILSRRLFRSRRLAFMTVGFAFLLVLIPLALYIASNVKGVEAAWWNDEWAYRKTVDIANSGSSVSNQYVKVTLDTGSLISAGKMKSDCSDLRATNFSGEILTHFVDGNSSYDCGEDDTSVYVLADSIPSSGTTLLLYYGNPSAGNIEPVLGTKSHPGLSCRTIKEHQNDGDSTGIYYITLSGNMANTIPAYCDMTTVDGGWTLMFQRLGGEAANNVDSCGSTLNQFLRGTCGTVSSLDYGNSYSIDLDNVSNYGEFMLTQYDSNMTFDSDDAFIIHSSTSLFPDSVGTMNNIAVTSVCDSNNSNCDNSDAYFKYTGDGWYGSAQCNAGYASGSYKGNYGYCENGVSTAYTSNNLFGNRNGYSETKLWAHDNGADNYMERTYVREASYEISGFTSSLKDEEQAPGPIAYWKFDEGTGSKVYDSTSNKNNGDITEATWQSEDQCISGKCLRFNNTSSYVTAPHVDFTGTFTVSLWLKGNSFNSTTDDGIVFQCESSSNNKCLHITVRAGKPYLGFYGDDLSASTSLETNKWYFISYVYDGTYQKIYINGVLDKSRSASSYQGTTGSTVIGRTWNNNTYVFDGVQDDIKIYPYARSADQIKADFTSRGSVKGVSSQVANDLIKQGALANGLIGYWKMDEASGNLTDSSGNGYTETVTGTTVTGGKFGKAREYNGSSDTATGTISSLPTASGTKFTVAFWMNWDGESTNQMPIDLGSSNIDLFFVSGTSFGINTYASDVWGISASGLSGGWKHVVVVVNNGAITSSEMYINGVKQTMSQQLGTTNNSKTAGTTVRIGSGSGNYFYDGKLDDVRIYNRALSSSEVSSLYNWAPGPVVYYDMEEGSGSGIKDKSGTGHNGTFTGGPTWSSGKYGKALSFSGSGNYVTVGGGAPLTSPTAWTYSAWIKPTAASAVADSIIGEKNNPAIRWGTTKKVSLFVGWSESPGYKQISSVNALELNKWSYVTGIVDTSDPSNQTLKLYVNGVLVASTNATTGTLVKPANTHFVNKRDSSSDFPGSIDEVRVYDYARTSGQIIEDMNASHPVGGSPVGSQIGYWKLDEGYGGTAHNSGNGGAALNGIITDATWSNSGKVGRALSFDGNNSVVTVPTFTYEDNRQYTLSAWIKYDGGQGTYLCKETSWNNGFKFWNTASSISFRAGDGTNATDFGFSSGVSSGKWFHLAVTRNNTLWSFYINGKLKYTQTNALIGDTNNNGVLKIGARDGWDPEFKGQLDEVKIYNTALTAEQIKLDMNQGKSLVLGSSSDTSRLTGGSVASSSASSIYCVPGSSDSCYSPVSEWNFEEKTNITVNDTSGNGNYGTWNGTLGNHWTKGKIGTGGNFNGSNNKVVINNQNLDGLSSMTVEAWINPSGYSLSYRTGILSRRGSSGLNFALSGPSDGAVGRIEVLEAGSGNVIGNTTLSINEWHHVAVSLNGSAVSLYVNGKYDGGGTLSWNWPTGTDITIGSIADITNYFFKGKIDQVKIYNYARTPAQVALDYNQGKTVGHWKFDECQGTVAHDSSENGAHGTISIGGTIPQTTAGTCSSPTDGSGAWYNGKTGKINYSLSLDGVDDHVSLGTHDPLGGKTEATVCSWLYYSPASVSTDGVIVSNYDSGGDGWLLWVDDTAAYSGATNTVSFAIDPNLEANGRVEGTSGLLTPQHWDHYCGVFKGGQFIRLYKNGILNSEKNTSVPSLVSTGGYTTFFGRSEDGRLLNAQLDDLRIFNYALTSTQVKQAMNQGAAVRWGPVTGVPN